MMHTYRCISIFQWVDEKTLFTQRRTGEIIILGSGVRVPPPLPIFFKHLVTSRLGRRYSLGTAFAAQESFAKRLPSVWEVSLGKFS